MRSPVEGTNPSHWVHPWERDTTRGKPNFSGASMHSSQLKATVLLTSCMCCGVVFGYPTEEKEKPRFCSAHRWIDKTQLLGYPHLENKKYDDGDVEVTGRMIRWSYFVPETHSRDVVKFRDGIRAWLVEEYLESTCLEWLPKVVVTTNGLVVTDLQRIVYDRKLGGIDYQKLAKIFLKIDEIYVTVL